MRLMMAAGVVLGLAVTLPAFADSEKQGSPATMEKMQSVKDGLAKLAKQRDEQCAAQTDDMKQQCLDWYGWLAAQGKVLLATLEKRAQVEAMPQSVLKHRLGYAVDDATYGKLLDAVTKQTNAVVYAFGSKK
jgi:hypothetical protein